MARLANNTSNDKRKLKLQYDEAFLVLEKQGANTRQAQYLVINETNMQDVLNLAWGNHQLKSSGGSYWTLLHRATTDRINDMIQRIHAVPREHQPGPAAGQYIATMYARSVDESDLENLSNPTIKQLKHIDREQAAIQNNRARRQAEEIVSKGPRTNIDDVDHASDNKIEQLVYKS
ncbi:hypothetical protein AC1031_004696 [Aphanomyces cochlioides]|nr:hypothetical protein AC1031_004696 [Aphanomyces cochlioides]